VPLSDGSIFNSRSPIVPFRLEICKVTLYITSTLLFTPKIDQSDSENQAERVQAIGLRVLHSSLPSHLRGFSHSSSWRPHPMSPLTPRSGPLRSNYIIRMRQRCVVPLAICCYGGTRTDLTKTCNNFEKLAERGYYNGVIFHRIIPVGYAFSLSLLECESRAPADPYHRAS
jgi:hypothetical protein